MEICGTFQSIKEGCLVYFWVRLNKAATKLGESVKFSTKNLLVYNLIL